MVILAKAMISKNMKKYFVYIMSNKKDGVLYIGSTLNLDERVSKHRLKAFDGFSKKYNTTSLVYFEETNSPIEMVERERQLKHWKREWKLELVYDSNPEWKDLSGLS
jgi:putative endonuclease